MLWSPFGRRQDLQNAHPTLVLVYCLKCQAKTGSRDVEQMTLKNGRPALRAVCSVCGTGKYRIGSAG